MCEQMDAEDFAARYLSVSEGVLLPTNVQQSMKCEGDENAYCQSTGMESKDVSRPLDGVPVFCTKDNLEKAFAILSQELSLLGFTMLQLNSSSHLNFIQLINTAFELLQQHKHNLRIQEDLEVRNSKTSCDIDFLHVSQVRLKSTLTQTEKTVKVLQEKERQLLDQNKCLQQKLKSEKDEMKKLTLIHQQREAQFQHDVRKREKETVKLKERLNQLLSDRTPDRRLGLEVLNSLPRKDGSRGKWKTTAAENKREEEMYRTILKDYEERHRLIIEENNILRHLLFKINDDLMTVLKAAWTKSSSLYVNHRSAETLVVAKVDELNLLSESHFYLPIETLHRLIRENFQLKINYLNNFMNQLSAQAGTENIQTNCDESTTQVEGILKDDILRRQKFLLQKIFNLWNCTEFQSTMPVEKKELTAEHEDIDICWKLLQHRNDVAFGIESITHEQDIPSSEDNSVASKLVTEQQEQTGSNSCTN